MFNRIFTGQSPVHKSQPPSRGVQLAALLAVAAATPLALPSTAAVAADMPVKAPVARTYNWGGCYVGLNGGGAESESNFTTGVGIGTHLTPENAGLVDLGGTGSAWRILTSISTSEPCSNGGRPVSRW